MNTMRIHFTHMCRTLYICPKVMATWPKCFTLYNTFQQQTQTNANQP